MIGKRISDFRGAFFPSTNPPRQRAMEAKEIYNSAGVLKGSNGSSGLDGQIGIHKRIDPY